MQRSEGSVVIVQKERSRIETVRGQVWTLRSMGHARRDIRDNPLLRHASEEYSEVRVGGNSIEIAEGDDLHSFDNAALFDFSPGLMANSEIRDGNTLVLPPTLRETPETEEREE